MKPTKEELLLDKQIYEIGQKIYVPIAANNYEPERAEFFKGKPEPEFVYHHSTRNPEAIRKEIKSIRIPNTLFGTLQKERLAELAHLLDYVTATNVTEASEATQKVFGAPDRKLIQQAQEVVDAAAQDPAMVLSLRIPAHQIIAALQKALAHYDLQNWLVKESRSPSQGIAVASDQKELRVQHGTTDTLESIPMIVTHEVDTHVICAENAEKQPTYLFGLGLAGWLNTQEGLAAYNVTQQHADEAERPLFHWALRVLAVDWALKGSFRDVYQKLTALGLDKNYAFATAFKVKRGLPNTKEPGSYCRDHIYFSGLHEVKKFVASGGNVRDLYVGRISIERVHDIKQFDWLEPPRHLPTFIAG